MVGRAWQESVLGIAGRLPTIRGPIGVLAAANALRQVGVAALYAAGKNWRKRKEQAPRVADPSALARKRGVDSWGRCIWAD